MRLAFEQHYVQLLRLCILLSGRRDIAEDLVQEAFVRAATRVPGLEIEEVGPYLRRVAVNVWKNRLRRLALENRPRALRRDNQAPEQSSYDERDALWQAVKRLPKRQRACVVLRFWEDLTESEVAVLLGCSVGTVKSHTSRALARLRKEVNREN